MLHILYMALTALICTLSPGLLPSPEQEAMTGCSFERRYTAPTPWRSAHSRCSPARLSGPASLCSRESPKS